MIVAFFRWVGNLILDGSRWLFNRTLQAAFQLSVELGARTFVVDDGCIDVRNEMTCLNISI